MRYQELVPVIFVIIARAAVPTDTINISWIAECRARQQGSLVNFYYNRIRGVEHKSLYSFGGYIKGTIAIARGKTKGIENIYSIQRRRNNRELRVLTLSSSNPPQIICFMGSDAEIVSPLI